MTGRDPVFCFLDKSITKTEENLIMKNFEPKYPSAIPAWIPEHQGKVRDSFALPGYDDLMLVDVTDRISTHNIVHESLIPGKGYSLTALTVFWMKKFESLGIRTHLVAYGQGIYRYIRTPETLPADLHLRAIVVRRLDMVDREFIFRDRMGGSLWKDYYSKGSPNPYGLDFPEGLQLMSKFPELVFTPTEKSENDDPVTAASVLEQHPEESALARCAFEVVYEHNKERGIETMDGKGEIGIDPRNGKPTVGDEFGTPDCCRYVEESEIVVGKEPSWLDKQYVREEAERYWKREGKGRHPISFSREVVSTTSGIYEHIAGRILDMPLSEYQQWMFS